MAGNLLTAFPVGLILAAVLSLTILPTFGWRALFAVGIIPAALLFFVRRYMPESVRYLLSKGRLAEAEQTVAHIERQALGRERSVNELQSMPQLRPEVAVKTGVTILELFTEGRALRTVLIWSPSGAISLLFHRCLLPPVVRNVDRSGYFHCRVPGRLGQSRRLWIYWCIRWRAPPDPHPCDSRGMVLRHRPYRIVFSAHSRWLNARLRLRQIHALHVCLQLPHRVGRAHS